MAQPSLLCKLRFYEGLRIIGYETPTVVTSSYLSPLITASIPSSFDPNEERKQIRRVFNLTDVRLLTEADIALSASQKAMTHVLSFDHREMAVTISQVWRGVARSANVSPWNQLQVSIAELSGQERTPLLETEIIIPPKNVAVMGFESRDGLPYFLSLHVFPPATEKLGETKEKEEGVVGGVTGGVIGGVKPGESRAVRAIGNIRPPQLIKKVNPIYPEEAKKKGLEGVVILEAETDPFGNIFRTQILRSVPEFDQAAIEAVRQWKYAPAIINGKPRGVIFTVTVSFRLKN